MNKTCMLQWVNNVLRPLVETTPFGIIHVLLLDSYRSSIVEAINGLGIQVEHIPRGCTGLCQPVGVGFNKSG